MVSSLRRLLLMLATFLAAAGPIAAEDGLLDETFSGDGRLLFGFPGTLPAPAQAQVVDAFPDGSLLVAGEVEVESANPDLGFLKLLPDGTIDSGWGLGGHRIVPIDAEPGGDDSVAALAILPDGSAIAAGFTSFYFPDEEFPTHRPALVRLNPEGDLEPDVWRRRHRCRRPPLADGRLLVLRPGDAARRQGYFRRLLLRLPASG